MVSIPVPPELSSLKGGDVVLAALLMLAALNGARRGLVRGGMVLAGLVGACYLAGRYYPTLAMAISDDPARRPAASLVAYVALLVLGLALATAASSVLYTLASKPPMAVLDRVAGALLGLLEGTLLVGLLLMALSDTGIGILRHVNDSSHLATPILDYTREMLALLPPEMSALARIAEESGGG